MTRPSDMEPASPGHELRAAEVVFAGGGELGALCRAFDWAATPLGPVEGWPQSLRTAAQTTVSSGLPSIVLWGRELTQIYNDTYARIIHAKHPAALGHGNQEIWPEVWHINGPIFERVFAGETVTHEDALYPLKRAGVVEDVYLTLSFSPIRDESGQVGGVLANMRETTQEVAVRALQAEREQLFEALARERERLEFVFRQAPAFLAVMRGPDHVFELANDAYYRIVGDRELIGRPLFDALPEVRDQGFEELLDSVFSSATPFIGREVPVLVAPGPGEPPRERFLDLVYMPFQDGDGAPSGVIAHGTDVTDHVHARLEVERLLADSETARADAEAARTEAKRSQAEAEEANQAKSQFLANMSHEIRTPINAILGYADLLEIGLRGSLTDGQQSYVDRIKASSLHLVGLINEILDFSKIEAGGMAVAGEPVLVRETARAALEMILPQAHAKSIEVPEDDECEPGATYYGDGDRVRQILVNLLSNAVKFTPHGGSITVRCRAVDEAPAEAELAGPGPWITVEVEDTGIGIAPGQLARIFEPFVQVDAGPTREQGGTGLGLTISRRLARMMNGALTVRSRAGEGSRFTLWLPAARGSSPPARLPDDAGPWPSAPGEVEGLAEIGDLVVAYANVIVDRFVDRLSVDPTLPRAHGLDRSQLEDHVALFVSAIGKSLISLDEGGGEPEVMRDGSEIQRSISDLHGDQRARLGWTEDELRREFEILGEEVDSLLSREASDPEDNVEAAIGILHRLLDRAERISLRSLADSR